MNGLSIFSLIAAALELSVPVYGLFLLRRFGSQGVGRLLVSAFCALALLHLVLGLKGNAIGLPNLDLVVAFASGLLLIGMGHLQDLNTQRRQTEFEGQRLTADWQLTLKEKTANLAGTNQQLLEEAAQHRETERALRQSEQQYRFIFNENPQPLWIFDLRSLRVLAVNRAALVLFGFSSEEFMALSARRLLQPDAAGFFMRDVSSPCPKAQSRGLWPFCTKNGSRIEAEISAVDLNYDGCPARLLAVMPVIERRCIEPEQPQVKDIETVSEPCCQSPHSKDRTSPAVVETQPEVVPPKSPQPASLSEPQKIAPTEIRSAAPEVQKSVSTGTRSTTLDSQKIAPPGTDSTASAREVISLPGRNSTPAEPAKPVASAPTLSDASRKAAAKQPDPRRAQPTPVTPKPAPRRSASGKETILLVEPDGKARGLARFILTRQGYRVIETDCSTTVLALWESESTGIDALLTDVALPEGISGSDLADQLRATKPELKVVYTSAVTETESEEILISQNIIPKPYIADKLLEAVKNCLVRGEEVGCAVV